jgi:hypothetical protein
VFNPTLPQRVIDRALEKDRAKATAEYLAEVRTELEGFVTLRARVGVEVLPFSGAARMGGESLRHPARAGRRLIRCYGIQDGGGWKAPSDETA